MQPLFRLVAFPAARQMQGEDAAGGSEQLSAGFVQVPVAVRGERAQGRVRFGQQVLGDHGHARPAGTRHHPPQRIAQFEPDIQLT